MPATDNIVTLGKTAAKFAEPALKKLLAGGFAARLKSKDASLWKTEPEAVKIISNSLGWVDAPKNTLERAAEISAFVREASKEFTHCAVLGMGGSSLAPEVFARVFPQKKGFLKLRVLDSTDPGWVLRFASGLNIEKTLFIFASKSGGTVEPSSFFKYFYGEAAKKLKNPSANFAAITDPGTRLENMAREMKFRKIFTNQPDIGGRFSALSLFGIVPAALMGVDVKKLLSGAVEARKACLSSAQSNPAVLLGAALGGCAAKKIDKAVLLLPPELETFGLWIEQLVAESTGKEGRGIVPVIGECPDGDDRLFIHFTLKKSSAPLAEKQEKAGRPVVKIALGGAYDLGAQFFIWEAATAAAGAVLKVNPFDQPNVQEAKAFAQEALKKLSVSGPQPAGVRLSKAAALKLAGKPAGAETLAETLPALIEKGDYAAILAYLDGSPDAGKLLSRLKKLVSRLTGAAVQSGWGPRYLHSTGQLHKGGADNGVFLILSAPPERDAEIPGAGYTFGQLESAQALGDFETLDLKNRRAVYIRLANAGGLKNLVEKFKEGSEMVKAIAKKTKAAKTAVCEPKGYVVIDHPKSGEGVCKGHYTFRVGASPCEKVEISIDDQPWHPCRHAVGYWWYDWSHYAPGTHQVAARLHKAGETLVSRRRRFKVA